MPPFHPGNKGITISVLLMDHVGHENLFNMAQLFPGKKPGIGGEFSVQKNTPSSLSVNVGGKKSSGFVQKNVMAGQPTPPNVPLRN